MARIVEAWESEGDKRLHSSKQDAIARELEMLVNPGALKEMSVHQAMRWIVLNFEEVKKAVGQ